jgi:hypothetical protein
MLGPHQCRLVILGPDAVFVYRFQPMCFQAAMATSKDRMKHYLETTASRGHTNAPSKSYLKASDFFANFKYVTVKYSISKLL